MRKIAISIITLFFLFVNILCAQDNIFNNYLLHNETFKISFKNSSSYSIMDNKLINIRKNFNQKFKRNPFANDKLKKFFDMDSKLIDNKLNLNINKNTKLTIGLKEGSSEFVPVLKKKEFLQKKAYSLDFKQFWGYNIASRFSYIYNKENFERIKNFNYTEEKYSFNITKFLNKDKFSFLYQYTTANSENNNENIYMLEDEVSQKISFSYEISFNKRFSLVLLYSLDESTTNETTYRNNLLFTGFKYFFDFNTSK